MGNLPLYQCHKRVKAAKISAITGPDGSENGRAELTLDVGGSEMEAVTVDADWLTRNPALAVGGYLVQYENGYTSFSPAEPFEKGYALVDGPLTFGRALEELKSGKRIARIGWNGKGMWLALSPGSQALPADKFWAGPNRQYAKDNGGTADVLPCITMKTATGEVLMGWLASQTDMLSDDWAVVE